MRTSLNSNYLLKELHGMKLAVGVNKTQLSCYLYAQGYHKLHKRPCFLFNYFIYLDHKEFMKIGH